MHKVIVRGNKLEIIAFPHPNKKYLALDFIQESLQNKNLKSYIVRLRTTFQRCVDLGHQNLTYDQFHPTDKLKEKQSNNKQNRDQDKSHIIYRFASGQLRIFCFFDGDYRIVITNGYIKKSQKTDQKQIKIARKIRNYYFNNKKEEL